MNVLHPLCLEPLPIEMKFSKINRQLFTSITSSTPAGSLPLAGFHLTYQKALCVLKADYAYEEEV